jgi:hypothetical protein
MAGNLLYISSLSTPLDNQYSVFSSSHLSTIQSKCHTNIWIIDIGATDHMVYSISFFTSITAVVSSRVKLPNGQFTEVTHVDSSNFTNLHSHKCSLRSFILFILFQLNLFK